MKSIHILPALALLLAANQSGAQSTNIRPAKDSFVMTPTPIGEGYWGNSYDAGIFSTSLYKDNMDPTFSESEFTTLRFTYIMNFGFNYNYDFNNSFGFFTGLGIKNIGLINKYGDSTVKRRVYTVGVPVGIKFGNMQKRNYGFIGGGLDVPFNYREKGFVNRRDKEKFSEWFSDRTPRFMPYVSAGFSINPGIIFKAQYYPGNFFNQDFREDDNSMPYAGKEANLLYISVGFDLHYKKLPKEVDDQPKSQATEM